MTPRLARIARGLAVATLLLLPSIGSASNGDITRIVAHRDGRPAVGIPIEVISTTSGLLVFEGTTDSDGCLEVSNLESGVRYQAQTSDGLAWSRSFEAGESVRFEMDPDRRGWDVFGSVDFVGTTQKTNLRAPGGAEVETTGGSFAIGIDIGAVSPEIDAIGLHFHPFVITGFEFPLLDPPTYTDPADNDATIDPSFRWRVGVGSSFPIEVGRARIAVEPSVAYLLTKNTFVTSLAAGGGSRNEFLSHALEIDLGLVVPLHEFGGSPIGLVLAGVIRPHLGGSATNASGVEGSEVTAYGGSLGLRVTLPDRFGRGTRPQVR